MKKSSKFVVVNSKISNSRLTISLTWVMLMGYVTFFSQSIGQTKKEILIYRGRYEGSQIDSWDFLNPADGQQLIITSNEFVALPGFYQGIPINQLENYRGENLEVHFLYMYRLYSESVFFSGQLGWVVTAINLKGTPVSPQKFILPKIGQVIDPDGYVNVRSQMDVKSSIVGKLEPIEKDLESFYFFTCSNPNWLRVDMEYEGQILKGYVHKSRIKILH